MSTEVEDPLSRLPEPQARSLIEAVSVGEWSRARSTVLRLGVSQAQAEHLLAWILRALRRGELPKPVIERPISNKCSPLISAWRCDVSVPRHLRTQLLWRLRLPNGRYVTLQLSLTQFHQVRYNIAMLLKELFTLKSNAICQK